MKFEKFYTDAAIINIEKAIKETKFSDLASIDTLQRTIALQLQALMDAAAGPIIDYEVLNKINTLYQSIEIIRKSLRG